MVGMNPFRIVRDWVTDPDFATYLAMTFGVAVLGGGFLACLLVALQKV